MIIISHRGYWIDPSEKNKEVAFDRSFSLGFGTETDFRDAMGKLVISHDLGDEASMEADVFFRLLARHDTKLPLAINIKADGLQGILKAALDYHGIYNYFLFDMSVPDAIQSIKAGLRIFTRHSDVELAPVLYSSAAGVWMDAFCDDTWITPDAISAHLSAGKQVCLVSPELHKRPHLEFWERIRTSSLIADDRLMLCSDIPEQAKAFFQHV